MRQRAGQPERSIEDVAVREEPLRDALADNHGAIAAAPIFISEFAAGDHRNSERRKEARSDVSHPSRTGCLRHLPACSLRR